jgi:hypothetical protein
MRNYRHEKTVVSVEVHREPELYILAKAIYDNKSGGHTKPMLTAYYRLYDDWSEVDINGLYETNMKLRAEVDRINWAGAYHKERIERRFSSAKRLKHG